MLGLLCLGGGGGGVRFVVHRRPSGRTNLQTCSRAHGGRRSDGRALALFVHNAKVTSLSEVSGGGGGGGGGHTQLELC